MDNITLSGASNTKTSLHISEHTVPNMTDIYNLIKKSIEPPEWMTVANVIQFLAIATAFFGVAAAVMRLWIALFRKIEVSFESTVEELPLTPPFNFSLEDDPIIEVNPTDNLLQKRFHVAIFCRPRRMGDSVDFFMGESATCDSGRSCLDILKWLGRWHCRIIHANDPVLMLCHGQEADVFRLRVVIRTPRRHQSDHVLVADGYFSGRSPDVSITIDRANGLKIGTKPAVRFQELLEGEEASIRPVKAIPTGIRFRSLPAQNNYEVV